VDDAGLGQPVSAFTDIPQLASLQIWDGVIGRVVHGERLTLAVVELEANSVILEHSHANEQVGLLVEGSLTFRVGDETSELGPGGAWRILANVPHEVATGPDGAVVIEVFSPRRDDWEQLVHRELTPPRWPVVA